MKYVCTTHVDTSNMHEVSRSSISERMNPLLGRQTTHHSDQAIDYWVTLLANNLAHQLLNDVMCPRAVEHEHECLHVCMDGCMYWWMRGWMGAWMGWCMRACARVRAC
eukprot:9710990-Alexandrium_andersonii.AAC.1